jgi:cation diffusion facilitator CzcD-associated flavoprotein CzcO
MATAAVQDTRNSDTAATHVDVLIVGAGISGIGSAYHLQEQCPGKSYVILEMKDTFGGTWETHKYPGVRSDSDLYTFGYRFKPWVGTPIASAQAILDYMGEVIEENGIGQHIRYGHRITRASWDSKANLWTIEATRNSDGARAVFTANFLWMCQGYYDHETPYMPDWPGMDRYKGKLIHAQLWDPKIDYKGKRILVIGSGATAATVIPEFAKEAAHVTMLQRSPTYFYCSENKNELADRLREVGIDEPTVHRVVRAQIMHDQDLMTKRCQSEPDVVFEELKMLVRAFTGKGTLIWGARTLAGNDNEWRFVSVRRLFNMIEESARKGTAFAVFEPNDMTTWLKVKGTIESLLYSLWERGALAGSKPEAAYFVHVGLGKTMNTQDVLEGRMIVEIGVAAVRPAEFIVLRFTHKLQEG